MPVVQPKILFQVGSVFRYYEHPDTIITIKSIEGYDDFDSVVISWMVEGVITDRTFKVHWMNSNIEKKRMLLDIKEERKLKLKKIFENNS